MRTDRATIAPAAAIAAMAAALALAPSAMADFAFTQADSPDPVNRGESVAYVVTVTNTSDVTEYAEISTLITRSQGGVSVPNPYISFSFSKGPCHEDPFPSPNGTYQGLQCDPVEFAPGETARLDAQIQANESMTHMVTYFRCDQFDGEIVCDQFPGLSHSVTTSVIYPPEITGSKKLRLQGLPEGCLLGDLELTARARGEIRKLTASISFPHTEWGGRPTGSFSAGKIDQTEGNRLEVKIRDRRLKEGLFYELKLVATRKGAPKLKRTVEFQVC